jgi:hypothetical protein
VRYNKTALTVVGHTDNVGSNDYNQKLSQRRAHSVAQYLESRRVDSMRLQLDDTSRDGLDPLVFGVVGTALNAVRRWLARARLAPPHEEFVDLLSEAVWHAIAGLARARGLVLDPDVPVDRLFESPHHR